MSVSALEMPSEEVELGGEDISENEGDAWGMDMAGYMSGMDVEQGPRYPVRLTGT